MEKAHLWHGHRAAGHPPVPAISGFGAERWVEGRHRPLILASASPRRREILALLGIPFEVVVAEEAEPPLDGVAAADMAEVLALAKARAVAQAHPQAVVLGADTVVILDGELMGKPASDEEATEMLRRLRGREHQVVTGVAVVSLGLAQSMRETSRVWMRDYSDTEVAAYVASGDPMDKAGAYAIQSPGFRPVARLEGCYLNVVGLPLCRAYHMLWQTGLELPRPLELPPEVRVCPRCRELSEARRGP